MKKVGMGRREEAWRLARGWLYAWCAWCALAEPPPRGEMAFWLLELAGGKWQCPTVNSTDFPASRGYNVTYKMLQSKIDKNVPLMAKPNTESNIFTFALLGFVYKLCLIFSSNSLWRRLS